MKTFWATFAAILAAAGVISGVWAGNRAWEKKAAAHLQILESIANLPSLAQETIEVMSYDKAEDVLQRCLEAPPQFTEYSGRHLPAETKISALRAKFEVGWEYAIKAARTKAGQWSDEDAARWRRWADAMETELKKQGYNVSP